MKAGGKNPNGVLAMHSDLEHVYRAVRENPFDLTPRMTYADVLDDHAGSMDDPDGARRHAAFIRMQCRYTELSRVCQHTPDELAGAYRVSADERYVTGCPTCTDRMGLRERIWDVWRYGKSGIHKDATAPMIRTVSLCYPGPMYSRNTAAVVEDGWMSTIHIQLWQLTDWFECWVCRPSRIRARLSQSAKFPCLNCTGYGITPGIVGDLCRRLPVRRFVISGSVPQSVNMGDAPFRWYEQARVQPNDSRDMGELPRSVYAQLVGDTIKDWERECSAAPLFATIESAYEGLSRALLGLGRKMASLTPLVWPEKEPIELKREG